jgi:hypothetical protein
MARRRCFAICSRGTASQQRTAQCIQRQAWAEASAYLRLRLHRVAARREGDSSRRGTLARSRQRLTGRSTRRSRDSTGFTLGPLHNGRFVSRSPLMRSRWRGSSRSHQLTEGTSCSASCDRPGDPAISPDGRPVALTIRKVDAPSALVVCAQPPTRPDTLAQAVATRSGERAPETSRTARSNPPRKRVDCRPRRA